MDKSQFAQDEVFNKLIGMSPLFAWKGYVKISYGGSPLRIVSVDPIEGTAVEYFDGVFGRV